jgi:CBS domain-containing protein
MHGSAIHRQMSMVFDSIGQPLEIGIADTVSRAVGAFLTHRQTAALVTDRGAVRGILTARSLAIRDIAEPEKTKITPYAEPMQPLLPGTEVREIAHSLLVNNRSAVPARLAHRQDTVLITQLDLLQELRGMPEIRGKQAQDIMSVPYCVAAGDTLATTKAMLKDLHISHLPVVDSQNRLEGLVDAESLLQAITPQKKIGVREWRTDRTAAGRIPISSFMKKAPPTAEPSAEVRQLIGLMLAGNATAVLIQEEALSGIVTAKDILKLIGEAVKGVYVRISGIQQEDAFLRSVADKEIEYFVKKIARIYPINYLLLNVDKHRAAGRRAKYSVKSTLFTARGTFFAQAHAWDLIKAVQGLLGRLEKEVIRKKEKEKPF